MKCNHIEECDQKISQEIFRLLCVEGKVGNLCWWQDDCFIHNDIRFVEQKGELKLSKEWEKEAKST